MELVYKLFLKADMLEATRTGIDILLIDALRMGSTQNVGLYIAVLTMPLRYLPIGMVGCMGVQMSRPAKVIENYMIGSKTTKKI